jgi:ketosteroid isomerase-like protein
MWEGFAILLLSLPLIQEPAAFSPDVHAAERRLADALQRHDRAAFEKLIEPDAVFFIPGVLQGRDAIVQGWIPFLAMNGSTLALEPVSVSGQGDTLVTEGRFSITGNGPVRPVVNAVYLAVWKRGADGWVIHSFSGGAPPPPRASTAPVPAALRPMGGLGDYRFGMSRQQVRQIPACAPYLDVPSTSGLECPNLTFEGRKMNVSFLFTGDTLRRVQLWYYEGTSEKDAKKAIDGVVEYLTREAGAVHSYELPAGAAVETDEIIKAVKKQSPPPGQPASVQLVTASTQKPEQLHARVLRGGETYMVLMFVSAR